MQSFKQNTWLPKARAEKETAAAIAIIKALGGTIDKKCILPANHMSFMDSTLIALFLDASAHLNTQGYTLTIAMYQIYKSPIRFLKSAEFAMKRKGLQM